MQNNTVISLNKQDIIKVTLKYEIRYNKSSSMANKRYKKDSIDLFFRIVDNDIVTTESNLLHIISEVILKTYLCSIQSFNTKWVLAIIKNVTKNTYITRCPLKDCYGNLESHKAVTEARFTYHLYGRNISPFRFSFLGVLEQIEDDRELQEKSEEVTKIFTRKIIVDQDNNNIGKLKFIKKKAAKKNYKNPSESFEEIDTAYPWGFVRKK